MRPSAQLLVAIAVGIAGCVTHPKPDAVAFEPIRDVVGAPFADNAQPAPATKNIVTLKRSPGGSMTVTLNGQTVAANALVHGFTKFADRSSTTVLIDAAATTTYGSILQVGNAALKSGICHVWMVNRVRAKADYAGPTTAAFELVPLLRPCLAPHPASMIDDRLAVYVDVYRSGQIKVNGYDEPPAHLPAELRVIVNRHRSRPDAYTTDVLLAGEPGNSWDRMVRAFDAAEQAGPSSIRWIAYESDAKMRCGLGQKLTTAIDC